MAQALTRHEIMDVEISIVNTSNRELLRRCLSSLPGACKGLSFRATVVDNASMDGSAGMVAADFADIRLLRNQRRLGFSANHNQVIRPVIASNSARYALILNEDTELDVESVTSLVAFADLHPRLGAVGPTLRGADGRAQASLFAYPGVLAQAWSSLRPGRPPRQPGHMGWLNGSCVLLRTAALTEVGPLDERFFIFFEDTDLGRRLCQAGWESAICPHAGIVHHEHRTVSKPSMSDAMERQMRRSQYLYFRKHSGWLAATALDLLSRGALFIRATKAAVVGVIGRDPAHRSHAALLFQLAAYDPSCALPHERAAAGALS